MGSCHNRQPVAVAVHRNLVEKPDQTELPDTSFWYVFSFSFSFYLLILYFGYRITTTWHSTSAEEGGHEVRGRKSEEQLKMGPNDVSDIVWAIGEFFFSISSRFLILTSLL